MNDLGEIKGVGVKMRGDLSTVGHCLELANPVQIFFDGCEDNKRFPLGLLFHSLWSFAMPR